MNKADLVNLVAARTELTKTDVSLVVDAAIETIIDSVVEGKKVSILGFGSFEPRERSARQGLNPKTGEKIKIPAKRVPETVERFVGLYQRERKDGEEFNEFFDRVGEEVVVLLAQRQDFPAALCKAARYCGPDAVAALQAAQLFAVELDRRDRERKRKRREL